MLLKLQINNTDVIEQVSSTDVTYKFPGPNHTFSVKALNQPITDSQTGTTPDVANSTSDQLSIYNGSTKLWGINESGYNLKPGNPAFNMVSNKSNHSGGHNPDQINGVTDNSATDSFINFNIGNHYDTTNYRFTAPIAGKYYFEAVIQLMATANHVHHCGIHFYVNGTEIFDNYQGTNGNYYHIITVPVIVNLSAGDYVTWGVNPTSGGNGTIEYSGGTNRCRLAGYLLG